MSEPIFRGVSKIFALKKHQLDNCHSHLVLSSKDLTLIFAISESSLNDITYIFDFNRNQETKLAYNIPLTSYVLFSTASLMTILDLSKIDSISGEPTKNENVNKGYPWDFVDAHNLVLCAVSSLSQCIFVFHLRNRPRDIDLIVPISEISLEKFDLSRGISSFRIYVTETEIKIFLSTYSGEIIYLLTNMFGELITSQAYFLGQTVESMVISKFDPINFSIFLGTRSGNLINFKFDSTPTKLNISSGPVKLANCADGSLLAYSFDSAVIIAQNDLEFSKRRIFDWNFEAIVEIIYQPGKTYFCGISDDCLHYISIPPLTENFLAKNTIFYGKSISSFVLLKSGYWIIAKSNSIDNSASIGMFNSMGSEVVSLVESCDEVIHISPLNESELFILAVLVVKDKRYSKLQILEVGPGLINIATEFVCDGFIDLIKCRNKYLITISCVVLIIFSLVLYCMNEEFFIIEVCPISKKYFILNLIHIHIFV